MPDRQPTAAGGARTRLRWNTAKRYWKVAVLFGIILFGLAAVPGQSRLVVQRSACQSRPSPLFGTVQSCPVFEERYHGGIWTFDTSLAKTASGTTDSPAALPSITTVHTGFHVLDMFAELAACLVLAIPAVMLVLFLSRRGRRTPVYGAVRRSRPVKLSKSRF